MAVFTTKWTFLALDKFTGPASKINSSVKKINNSFTQLAAKTNASGQAFNNLSGATSGLRAELSQLIFTGLAFAGPIKAATTFEDSLTGIKKAVDGISDKQLQQFSKTALELSSSIPLSAAGIVDIATQGAKLGIPLNDLEEFAKLASKTAVALDMNNLEQVGKDLGNLSNIFGLNTTQMESFLDVVDTFDNKINTTGETIVRSLVNKGARGAKALGLNNDQTIALVATLDSFGIRAERVGRGVLSMANSLSSSKVRNALNLKTLDLLKKDPQEGLNNILKSLGKLPSDVKMAKIQEMFGRDFSDVILTLVNNFDKYQKNVALSSDKLSVAGALQREFQVKMETTTASLKILRGQINKLAINIGSAFLPALQSILSVVSPMIGKVADLAAQFPKVTATILGVIGAAFGLRIVRVILRLIKLEALGVYAALNPIGTVLVGLAAGAVYLFKKFKPFHDAVISVKNFFVSILDTVNKIADKVATLFGSGGGDISPSLINASASPTLDRINAAAGQAGNGNLNININDPGNNVGLVQGSSDNLNLNVGRNMPSALSGTIFGGTLAGVS